MDKSDLCSASNGVHLKMNLSKLEIATTKVRKDLGVVFA
jgi:hypothetical protein